MSRLLFVLLFLLVFLVLLVFLLLERQLFGCTLDCALGLTGFFGLLYDVDDLTVVGLVIFCCNQVFLFLAEYISSVRFRVSATSTCTAASPTPAPAAASAIDLLEVLFISRLVSPDVFVHLDLAD